MRRRIYWLLPDLASARRTMNDLLLARITEGHIHFVARENADTSGLHTANVLQTSDVVHAAESGLVIGGATGAVVGIAVALFFPIAGDAPAGLPAMLAVFDRPGWTAADLFGAVDARQWGMAAVLAILGGLVGAWSSSMIGVSTPSSRLARFQGAIDQGQILLMVDVPHSRVAEIERLLETSHPEARFEGEEPDVPAFP